jgi:hypothetical protein
MTGSDKRKEMMVVVKRGTRVDYEEKSGPPGVEDDVIFDGMKEQTWALVGKLRLGGPWDLRDEVENENRAEHIRSAQHDVYEDVYDYAQSFLHFHHCC